MNRRRQPLCVLLLVVIALSTFYMSEPVSQRSNEAGAWSPSLNEPRSVESDSTPQPDAGVGEVPLSAPEAAYPSSVNAGPRPAGSGGASTNGPVMLDYHGIKGAQDLGLPAGRYDGSNVAISVVDYGLDLGQPDLVGSQLTAPSGTYAGWPVAFDPRSMGIFLRDKKYEGTYYANTTKEGKPPFEVTHTVLVDGRSDLAESEKLLEDPAGTGIASADGAKNEYDLTKLYVTHDEKFWYFAFPVTSMLDANLTYGLLIDVDNETSGTTTVPEGKLVNANTTHAGSPPTDAAINDVAVSPDGTKVATTSSDKHVKVWQTDGTRLFDFTPAPVGHGARPYSLAWSPNGTFLASRDYQKLFIWNLATGKIHKQIVFQPTPSDDIGPGNEVRYPSSLSFSADGAWIAVTWLDRVHVYSAITGVRIGNMDPGTGSIRSLSFSPQITSPPKLAVGLNNFWSGGGPFAVGVFDMSPVNLNSSAPTAAWLSIGSGFGGHTGEVLGVSWSPDAGRIASVSRDGTFKLWAPPQTTALIGSITDPTRPAYSVAWQRKPSNAWFATVAGSGLTQPPKASLRLYDYNGVSKGYFELNRTTHAVDWTNSDELFTGSLDLSVRKWSMSGRLQSVLAANKPDFAVMIDAGLNYSLKDLKWVKVVYNGTFYSWNDGVGWGQGHELTKSPINGTQAFFGIDELFVELGVPTSILGYPAGVSAMMFSAGTNVSHAQDSVPIDATVFDIDGDGCTDKETPTGSCKSMPALDWAQVETPLSAFQYVPVTYYKVDTAQFPSVSGVYHFGYHPSPQIATAYGSLGIIVTDPVQNGSYTRVCLDMYPAPPNGPDHIFDSRDVCVDKNQPIAGLDTNGDLKYEISAGMIYFIADGVNYLPYSERFRSLNGIEENNKPGNGDLVAFAGEFRLDPDTNAPTDHGTRVASIIASRGLLDSAVMSGIAPAAKVVSIMNGPDDVISSWYFAVEGYDGTPGTGDEAQIVVNPFEYPRTRDKGYDSYSRTVDYLSSSYSAGKTIFFGPAGEEGYGYGSIASPSASPGIVTVGRLYDDTAYVGIPEGPSPHFKIIPSISSRGPTASGFPKPDLVAIGNTAADRPWFMGLMADEFAFGEGGSEVSAAIVAGAATLLLDAAARASRQLTLDQVREYLMSGAENLGYDILVQGAGYLNATRSMKLLLGNQPGASALVSPANWVPGTYKGEKPEAYTKILFPATGDMTSFKITNRDTSALTLTLSGDILEKQDGYAFSNTTSSATPLGQEINEVFLWVNRSGVFAIDPATSLPKPIRTGLPPSVWDDSEMLKLSVFGNYSNLIVPAGIDAYASLYCYDLKMWDWTWDPFGLGFPNPTYSWEMNRLDEFSQTANVLEGRVPRPGQELHDALVFELVAHIGNPACKKPNLRFDFEIDFFQRAAFSWLSLSPTSLTNLAAGADGTVTATMSIPAGAAMGSYELAMYVDDGRGHEVTVPILVNVATNSPNFKFGGNLPTTGLHDVNRIYGGRNLEMLGANTRYTYLGDWRFFYLFLPDEGINVAGASIKMVIQLNWTVKPSDLDLMALSPSPAADTASQFASTRFGPRSDREVSASETEVKPIFKTLSNSSQDFISFQLMGGLNVIGIHQMILNGNNPYETFQGSGMWWRVPREMRKPTQSLTGTVEGSAMLSNDLFGGFRVSAVGPAITTKNVSEPIKLDWQDWMRALPFANALAKGSYTYCIQLKKVLILDVHLMGLSDVVDLDLGLFRDLSDDCKLDEATEAVGAFCQGKNQCSGGGYQWALDADGDADEEIKWVSPPDGRYIIKILGFDVPGGLGHFNLDVSQTLDTGTGYKIVEANNAGQILDGTSPLLPSFKIVSFNMSWDFLGDQEDGNYSGAVQMGTANAPGIVVVPALVILDRVAPRISSFAVQSSEFLVNTTNPSLTNDPLPTLVVGLTDPTMGSLDRSTFKMVLDSADVTPLMQVSLVMEASPYAAPGTTGAWGKWRGDMKYRPMAKMSDGIHTLYVVAGDEAGNRGFANFTFTIDMQSPSLMLLGPPIEYTRDPTMLVQGQAEAGAYVLIGGQWAKVDSSGIFSSTVSLEEGNNLFEVTATRWFMDLKGSFVPANPVKIQKNIIRDLISPIIVGRSTEPSGSYVNVDSVVLIGQVADDIANNTPLNPGLLNVTVNGNWVQVMPDGGFSTIVPLTEGQNSIVVAVTDPAGNSATGTPVVVTRDTTAPVLTISGVPERVEAENIEVTVNSESGLKVTVNGFDTTVSGGTYTRSILLSPGTNTIVVKAEDRAKNVVETRLSVMYAAKSGLGSTLFGPAGGAGAIAAMVILVIAIVIVVLFLMRWWMGGRGKPEEGEVAVEEEVTLAEEEVTGEQLELVEGELGKPPEAPEEIAPTIPSEEVPPAKPPEAAVAPEEKQYATLVIFRVTRAKRALDEGKISQNVYEQNLDSMGISLAEADKIIEKAKKDEETEVGKNQAAQRTYAELTRKPPQQPLAEAKIAPSKEEKKKTLRKAFDEGKIGEEVYKENLRKIEES